MNFNHLHYFHAIAEEGSLSRAAKKLNISQATLSGQLKLLEEYFETKLFDRGNGVLRLNSNGRKALEVTGEMFRLSSRLEEMFPGRRPPAKVRVEIGISNSVGRSFAIRRFIELFKNLRILTRVRQGEHEYLYHELLSSGLDLLVTDSIPDKRLRRGTEYRKLSSPEFVVVAGKKLAATLTGSLPDSLHGLPFIHYTSHNAYRFEIDQYFRDNRIEPNIVAEADDVYLIREAVGEDVGVGIIPRSVVEESRHPKNFVILGQMDRPFEIHAIYNKQNPSEEILAVLDILSDKPASAPPSKRKKS